MAPETIPWGERVEVEAVPAETPLPTSLARERQARTRKPRTDHQLRMRCVRRLREQRGGRDGCGQSGGESQQNRQQDEQPHEQRGVEWKAYTSHWGTSFDVAV